MIIYNKTWLSNLALTETVEEEYKLGLLTETEFKLIKQKYATGFYSTNIFVRVGLFFLTMIISSFGGGFLSLFALDSGILMSPGWFIFLGLLNYAGLEYMVQKSFHFRSGVDDALIYLSAAYLGGSFYWIVMDVPYANALTAAFVGVLSAVFVLRFLNVLMSLICCVSFLAFVFFAWQKIGPLGLATMPFLLMICSGLIYWLMRKYEDHESTLFYGKCLAIVQVVSLLFFYASGNYLMVKELGDMVNGKVSASIPMGWFFWGFTFFVPLVYVFCGVRMRNKILLRTGLVLIPAAVLTFRNYYHVMPLEFALTICGIVVLCLAWFVHRYLQVERNGFTERSLYKIIDSERLALGDIVVSQSVSGVGGGPGDDGGRFGGGKFGGGGANSGF